MVAKLKLFPDASEVVTIHLLDDTDPEPNVTEEQKERYQATGEIGDIDPDVLAAQPTAKIHPLSPSALSLAKRLGLNTCPEKSEGLGDNTFRRDAVDLAITRLGLVEIVGLNMTLVRESGHDQVPADKAQKIGLRTLHEIANHIVRISLVAPDPKA